tara:strand:- start:602 stop:1993 length:1392 start_codon:yes stop_codon:yes gene_type:complete
MSDPIKTTPIMIRWGKDTIFDWSDDVTYYYKEEMVVSGTAPNRTFAITILRSDTSDFSVSTEIGTRNKIGGAIKLNEGADPVEKKYLNTLTRKLKGSSSALTTLFAKFGNLSNEEKTALNSVTGTTNVATVSADNNTTGGKKENDPPKTFNLTNTSIDVSIAGRRFRKQYGHFSYPEDLRTNKQDRVRFTQKYSEGTKIEATITSGEKNFQRRIKKVRGSVTLPIVTGIEDTNSVDFNEGKLNPIQAIAGASALGIFEDVRSRGDIAGAFSAAGGGLNRARGELRGQVGSDIASAINVYLAQSAVGAQGLLSRTTGAVLNPNLELLFGGPKLRSFGFTFKLSARDATEADQIRKIIRFFKQGMSVKTSSSNVFLKSPNLFDIQYQTFNTNGDEIIHPSINIIKTCALTSCNVRYAPDGTYMTYDDPFRTLTSYQLTMQFSELDPIYDSDYSELDQDQDQVIGY